MIRSAFETISCCRSCGHRDLTPVLDLGRTPLANALLNGDELDLPEATFPLQLVFCSACSLVQITCTVPPQVLFDNYPYFSSFSKTMCDHAEQLVSHLIDSRQLSSETLAVEIASNDGYLLKHYKDRNIKVLGIEPAQNIASAARDKYGIETLCEFFTLDLAKQLRTQGIKADVIHAHNVLAHVADLNGFVAGMATLLAPDGVAVIEAPYVRDMIDRNEFDTIYHEHLCYFSLTSLDQLFKRHGLCIIDADRVAIHGGSLRIMAGHAGVGRSSRVTARLDEEKCCGMDKAEYYRNFADDVQRLRGDLCALLSDLKSQGKSIAVYGASAKGSTLLNYCKVSGDTLDFVADRSTVKQGRFTPGTRLPIVDANELAAQKPDYTLLLTWNFSSEILEQQREYLDAGGRFIIPIPKVQVV